MANEHIMIGTERPTFPEPAPKHLGGANFWREPSSPIDKTNDITNPFTDLVGKDNDGDSDTE